MNPDDEPVEWSPPDCCGTPAGQYYNVNYGGKYGTQRGYCEICGQKMRRTQAGELVWQPDTYVITEEP